MISLLVGVAGFILGIVMGNTMGSISSMFSRSSSSFNAMAMFIVWIITALIVLGFLWMGALLNRLESIDNKLGGNNSDENNALASAYAAAAQHGNSSIPGANEWKCPKCGRINSNYAGNCSCGQQKPTKIFCEHCRGDVNPTTMVCYACGKQLTNLGDYGTSEDSNVRICENCRCVISDKAKYCRTCGAKQNSKLFL